MHNFHNGWGFATIAILSILFVAGLVHSKLTVRKLMRGQQERIAAIAPPPIAHVHTLDIDRSEITVTQGGAIFGRCAIAGCKEGIFVSPNMAGAWDSEPEELTREIACAAWMKGELDAML